MSLSERLPVSYDQREGLRDAELVIGELAQHGELPCPCCEAPLAALAVFDGGDSLYQGVVLCCKNQAGCGFIEY